MIVVAILIIGVLISAFTGLFVYSRNTKRIVNRLYGLLTVSLLVYTITNYFSLQTDDRLFYIRCVICASTVIVSTLYYLIVFLGVQPKNISKLQKIGIYLTPIVALLNFTPLVFNGLTPGHNPAPTPGYLVLLFIVHLIIYLANSCILLVRRARKTSGNEHLQYLYMLVGIAPLFLFAPLTGFVLPVIYQNVSLVFLNPIYTTFFVAMVGYSIVKHRLFDIRLVVARSIGYLLSILSLAALNAFFASLLFNRLFRDSPLSLSQQLIYIAAAVALAFLFQPLKHFFDTLTSKIFYRDAYDPQVFIDTLNKLIVSTLDLRKLLLSCSELINNTLKSEYAIFFIEETNYFKSRLIGVTHKHFSDIEIKQLNLLTRKIMANVVVIDELEEYEQHRELAQLMHSKGIEVLIRLTTFGKNKEGIGYLILGPKKSGNTYMTQDIRILNIIANELTIAIQNALRFEEIENFNVTLQQKVNTATHKLRVTNEKLKALDETKDEFISMASHQLRTPLTSVKGYVSMVLEGDAGNINDMQRKLLDQAFISAQRMVFLIADLLNVSRLKTGKFVIEKRATNLAELVGDEVSQLRGTAEARNLKLFYNKPEKLPLLMLDETKIRQVVMNFIDNAIYYSAPGGEIHVTLEDIGESVELRVVDTGMGVPKGDQHRLFTKFYRAGNAKKARPDGTGLGLFMAKRVIVEQGGAIIFKSQEDKGSTFGFSFPKGKLLADERSARAPKMSLPIR